MTVKRQGNPKEKCVNKIEFKDNVYLTFSVSRDIVRVSRMRYNLYRFIHKDPFNPTSRV